MKLVIFDMDQTLVEFIGVHNMAMRRLFKNFFNVDASFTEIDFAGKSLRDSILELARLKQVPEADVQRIMEEILEYYENAFGEEMPQNASRYILPGVRRLLKRLSQTDNMVVLYTGDSEGVVKCVFEATGLGKYFRFAVYGTEARNRVDMAMQAVRKAEKLAGRKFEGKDVVIIGDSVRDVDCGRQMNALTIAVASGFHSMEQLQHSRPDYLFTTLKDYKKVMEAIG